MSWCVFPPLQLHIVLSVWIVYTVIIRIICFGCDITALKIFVALYFTLNTGGLIIKLSVEMHCASAVASDIDE